MITATDRTVALHAFDSMIAGLQALRTVVATLGADSTSELVAVDAPLAPVASEIVVPTPNAATQPPKKRGRGGRPGRPRKHFTDRKEASTGAERVAISRAKRVAKLGGDVAKPVSQQSLSLSEDSDLDLKSTTETERENGTGGTGERGAMQVSQQRVSQHYPLPADWEPNEESKAFAHGQLGEIGAANSTAKFCDHHSTSGHRTTAAGWQSKYRNWVRSERTFRLSPGSLPLFSTVANSTVPRPAPVPAVPLTPQQEARWAPILAKLTAVHGEAVASSWFTGATLGTIAHGVATVAVPTRFLRSWLTQHYADAIRDAIATVHPDVTQVHFVAGTVEAAPVDARLEAG
jgi:hypothetical protein